MDDYITAERRGGDSLRRFLLDLDAKEANEAEARTIAEILELYLAANAHPRNEGGLAPSTYSRYESAIDLYLLGKPRRHPRGGTRRPAGYAVAVACVPAVRFNEPQAPRAWREDMQSAGVSKASSDHAWAVLSAALSWAAASQLVPEIQTNGCGLANESRVSRRRSMRHGGTGYTPIRRPSGLGVASWALSPQAVEAIRAQMLLRVRRHGPLLAHRDAIVVSLQYGLCARNQEVWGLRWASLDGEFACVLEVLSGGQLEEWGKTEHSTKRRTAMPSLLQEDLCEWRAALSHAGHPVRDVDFILPETWPAQITGSATQRQGRATSAKAKRTHGALARSRPPSRRPRSDPNSPRSSAPPPMRCAAAESRYVYAPRIPKPSPASAAQAQGCSTTTTHTPSKTSGATRHDPLTSSGAPHAPRKQSSTPTSRHRPPARSRNLDIVGADSLRGSKLGEGRYRVRATGDLHGSTGIGRARPNPRNPLYLIVSRTFMREGAYFSGAPSVAYQPAPTGAAARA